MVLKQVIQAVCVPALIFGLFSCAKPPPPPPPPPQEVFKLRELIDRINRNNAALPTLYAKHDFEGDFFDPRTKKSRFLNGSGDLFLLKPRDMLFRARKDPVGDIFQMGSTQEQFWFTALEGEKGMWWGHHRNAGKPCMREMPVRPDLVGEVLGIYDIAPDLKQAPFPTMRFNSDAKSYMLVWNAPLADRWYAEKEIWYDQRTLRPTLVLLFDRDGKIVLRAYLAKHKQVEVEGAPQAQWPWVATNYRLFFPETRSKMTIDLSDLALRTKTGQPKPGMIRFPEDVDVPESKVVQIDVDCDKER
jgi:hypothetical protein